MLNLPIIEGRIHSPEVKLVLLSSLVTNNPRKTSNVTHEWRNVWQLGAVDSQMRHYFAQILNKHDIESQARHIYRLMTHPSVRRLGRLFRIDVMHAWSKG